MRCTESYRAIMMCVKGGSLGQHQVRNDKAVMWCPGRGCKDRAQGLVSVHSRQRTSPGLREPRYDVRALKLHSMAGSCRTWLQWRQRERGLCLGT